MEQNTQPPQPKKRYVWLNLNTGAFSNSWSEEDHKRYNPESQLEKYRFPESKGWKLIEYTCLNDEGFEFNNQMKLK